jgi:hypothetical protein
MYPIGKIVIVDVSCPANITNSSDHFRPPVGMEWININTMAQHNNVANTTITWEYYDAVKGLAAYMYAASVATNSNVFLERASTRSYDLPLKSTHDVYVRARFSPEAGKRLRIISVFIERPENLELLLEELKGYGAANKYKLPISSRE